MVKERETETVKGAGYREGHRKRAENSQTHETTLAKTLSKTLVNVDSKNISLTNYEKLSKHVNIIKIKTTMPKDTLSTLQICTY